MHGQSNVACLAMLSLQVQCTQENLYHFLSILQVKTFHQDHACRQHLQFIWWRKPISMKFTCSVSILIPYGEYPSCLQITLASLLSQKSSQMVPQVPLTHTSTLPYLFPPDWSLKDLSWQGAMWESRQWLSFVNWIVFLYEMFKLYGPCSRVHVVVCYIIYHCKKFGLLQPCFGHLSWMPVVYVIHHNFKECSPFESKFSWPINEHFW